MTISGYQITMSMGGWTDASNWSREGASLSLLEMKLPQFRVPKMRKKNCPQVGYYNMNHIIWYQNQNMIPMVSNSITAKKDGAQAHTLFSIPPCRIIYHYACILTKSRIWRFNTVWAQVPSFLAVIGFDIILYGILYNVFRSFLWEK